MDENNFTQNTFELRTQYLLSCLRARYYSNKCVSRSQILDMNLNSTYEKAFQMNSSSKDVSSIYI